MKIQITTDSGELLDTFTIDWPGRVSGNATQIDLANKIREILEQRFEVEDT